MQSEKEQESGSPPRYHLLAGLQRDDEGSEGGDSSDMERTRAFRSSHSNHSSRTTDFVADSDENSEGKTTNTSRHSAADSGKHPDFDIPKLDRSAMNGPIDYISSMSSKGVRTALIDGMNNWYQVPETQLAVIKSVINKLHNSSLILDDMQDDSPMRRGKTATHLIFGAAQSMNSANFMQINVAQEVHATGNTALMSILLEDLEDLHIGQSWDLYWKYNLKVPTEDEYFSMIDLKTGGLFRMLSRMMQSLSPVANKDFGCDTLTSMVSRYFQIRDDYQNLNSREYTTQKGWCEDLDEGKFSYPIIHCLQANPDFRDRIIGFFRQRIPVPGTSMPVVGKIQIIEYLREAGTFDACWRMLRTLEEQIETEIKRLEKVTEKPNPQMHHLLKLLSVKDEKPDERPVVAPAGM